MVKTDLFFLKFVPERSQTTKMKKIFFLAAMVAFSLATVANAGNGDDKNSKKSETKKECSTSKACCKSSSAKACSKADEAKACQDGKAAKAETAKADVKK